jgi:hypothetical protein
MWGLHRAGGMSDVRGFPTRVHAPMELPLWRYLVPMQFHRIGRRVRCWGTHILRLGLGFVHREHLWCPSRAQLPWPWHNRMRNLLLCASTGCCVRVQMLNLFLNSEVFFLKVVS